MKKFKLGRVPDEDPKLPPPPIGDEDEIQPDPD